MFSRVTVGQSSLCSQVLLLPLDVSPMPAPACFTFSHSLDSEVRRVLTTGVESATPGPWAEKTGSHGAKGEHLTQQGDSAVWPDQAPVVLAITQAQQAVVRSTGRTGWTQKGDLQVLSPTMQFGEFGDHLVPQTTSYMGIDVVGSEANRTERGPAASFSRFDNLAGRSLVPKLGWWMFSRGHLMYFHFGRRQIGQNRVLHKYHLLPI